jgi:hypothetical protein
VKEIVGGKVRFAEYRHMMDEDLDNKWDQWYVGPRSLSPRCMMVSFKGLVYLWTAKEQVKVVLDVSFKDDFVVDVQVSSNEIVINDVLKVNEHEVLNWTFVRRFGIMKEMCGILNLSWIVPLEYVSVQSGTLLSKIASPYGLVFVHGDGAYQYGYTKRMFVLGDKFVNFMVLTVKGGYALKIMKPNAKNLLRLTGYAHSNENLIYECGQVCVFKKQDGFWQYVKRSDCDTPDQEFRVQEIDRSSNKQIEDVQAAFDRYFKVISR